MSAAVVPAPLRPAGGAAGHQAAGAAALLSIAAHGLLVGAAVWTGLFRHHDDSAPAVPVEVATISQAEFDAMISQAPDVAAIPPAPVS
ncbi:MAG: hypothetical protein N2422_07540, partial [Rhodobacteraceae bacterium]|nr:hypothetical protein [Paracoccaceae bacterium]